MRNHAVVAAREWQWLGAREDNAETALDFAHAVRRNAQVQIVPKMAIYFEEHTACQVLKAHVLLLLAVSHELRVPELAGGRGTMG
jgi:hypothetical protein